MKDPNPIQRVAVGVCGAKNKTQARAGFRVWFPGAKLDRVEQAPFADTWGAHGYLEVGLVELLGAAQVTKQRKRGRS